MRMRSTRPGEPRPRLLRRRNIDRVTSVGALLPGLQSLARRGLRLRCRAPALELVDVVTGLKSKLDDGIGALAVLRQHRARVRPSLLRSSAARAATLIAQVSLELMMKGRFAAVDVVRRRRDRRAPHPDRGAALTLGMLNAAPGEWRRCSSKCAGSEKPASRSCQYNCRDPGASPQQFGPDRTALHTHRVGSWHPRSCSGRSRSRHRWNRASSRRRRDGPASRSR